MATKNFSGDNRVPMTPEEIAATDPIGQVANAPSFEPGRAAIPVVSAPQPETTVNAEGVEMVEGWEQDANQQWVKVQVPKTQAKIAFEEMDRYTTDPMGLGEVWDSGRGKEFHARWANANPQHRIHEAQARFAPVLAENVPPAIRNRCIVSNKVPGFEGLNCLVFGDAVLMEKPKVLFEEGYKRRIERRRAETRQMEGAVEGADVIRTNSAVGPVGTESRGGANMDPQRMMAEATAEAEAIAHRQLQESGKPVFGGFQGNPDFNHTNWGRQ